MTLAVRLLAIGTAIAFQIPAISSGKLIAQSQANITEPQGEVKRELSEDLKIILTYTKHPNPQQLSPKDFALKLGSSEFGPIEKVQVNGRNVIFRKTGYMDYVHAWFHPQGKTEILEIETRDKDSLIQLLNNFPLIGVQPYSIEEISESWANTTIKPKLKTVTIDMVNNQRGEYAHESTITYLKEWYLDDSIGGEKIIIKRRRTDNHRRHSDQTEWEITNIQNLKICRRLKDPRPTTKLCL